MPVTSLHNVPLDILLIILGNVDPISLINLAQTCQALRATIRPTRANLLQRLLALELIPEYGGIVPLLRGRDSQISPPMGSKDWQSNKYACGGCLKLLPHTMFDNHNILRLDLRKPPPGSIEANRLAEWWYLDGWDDRVRARIIQHRVHTRARDESLGDMRRRYHEATHPWEGMPHPNGVNQFLWAQDLEAETLAANDRIASDAELLICGLRRHNRRCNECRFLRGDWRRFVLGSRRDHQRRGVSVLPMATGRTLLFYNLFDRCFPTLFHPVPLSETDRRMTQFGNQQNKTYPSVMRTIRCGGCAKWQDLSQFRFSVAAYQAVNFLLDEIDGYLVQDAELGELRDPRCNRCFLREHGMAAFRRHLVAFARSLMLDAIGMAQSEILFGWGKLRDDFRLPVGAFANYWAEYGRPIVSDFPFQGENLRAAPFLTTQQLDDLLQRYTRFTIFVEQMYQGLQPGPQTSLDGRSNEEVMSSVMTSWFRIWYEDYHLYERTYRRLQDRLKWIEQHEQEVVSYALGVDPLAPERYDFEVEVEEGVIIE